MGSHHEQQLPGAPVTGDGALLTLYLIEVLSRSSTPGGDAVLYQRLVKELSALKRGALEGRRRQRQYLQSLLTGLAACVSYIDTKAHALLLTEIHGISLWEADPVVRQATVLFMTQLLLARSSLLQPCLQFLVDSLMPPAPVAMSAEPGTLEQDPASEELQAEVVAALIKVLQLVPTAPPLLVAAAADRVPHVLRDRATQVLYMRALLRLAFSGPGAVVRRGLLAVVVKHLVALDCEIRWQDIAFAEGPDASEEVQEEQEEDVFKDAGDQLGVAAEAAHIAHDDVARGGFEGAVDSQGPASSSGRTKADEFAEKMDGLMDLVLTQLAGAWDQGQGPSLLAALLPVFEASILPAHRTKFSQFLLWFLCAQDPAQAGRAFVDLLMARMTTASCPVATRTASAAYLASFLARAGFLPVPLLSRAIQSICAWCDAYCSLQPASKCPWGHSGIQGIRRGSLGEAEVLDQAARHQVFYAACQAMLYVLCYRVDALMAPSGDPTAMQALFSGPLQRIISHWLAPLSTCLPTVAREFLSSAARLNLLPPAFVSASPPTVRAQRPLELFFPFDPYLLRSSAARLKLEGSYLRWSSRPGAAAPEASPPEGHLAEELADVELDGDDASTSSSSSSGLSDEEGSEAGHSEPEDEVGPLSPSGPMEQKWRMATGGSAGQTAPWNIAPSPRQNKPPGEASHLLGSSHVTGSTPGSAMSPTRTPTGSPGTSPEAPDAFSGTPMSWTPHLQQSRGPALQAIGASL